MTYGYDPQISSLPPEVQELAHQRQREQGNSGTFKGSISSGKDDGNFNWDNTPEEDFWNSLHEGDEDIEQHPNYPKTSNNYQIF